MHKGHYGEYTGNAKHSKVTASNFDATKRDDEAHMKYLKEDVDYDNKHGHSDESMTADEKHISKLAGDLKYDEKNSPFHQKETYKKDYSGGLTSRYNYKKEQENGYDNAKPYTESNSMRNYPMQGRRGIGGVESTVYANPKQKMIDQNFNVLGPKQMIRRGAGIGEFGEYGGRGMTKPIAPSAPGFEAREGDTSISMDELFSDDVYTKQ
tara:strand:+ start:406 stop:1032 length:627 start_codon:yes stop_codon:yes gene_type:complete